MTCGCAERKQVMFTDGRPGVDCLVVLTIPVFIYLLARAAR